MNRKQRRAAHGVGNSIPQSRPQDMFATAFRHHQAGRLKEAEQLYRRILQVDSYHADTLHWLGILAHQIGRSDIAVELIAKAIAQNGQLPGVHNNLGLILQTQGKLDEAVASYGRALFHKPDDVEAYFNLGNVLQDQGKLDEAVVSYGRALAHKPDFTEAQNNLGNVLMERGKSDEAAASYGRALFHKPDYAEAHFNLGNALRIQGKLDEAVASYGRALFHKPDYAEAHFNLGNVLRDQGKSAEAVASYGRALAHKPDYAEAHGNLGNAFQDQGKLEEAVASYGQALAHKPNDAEVHYNLGNALQDQGKLAAAVTCYQLALNHRPDFAEVYGNLGNALLKQGKLAAAATSYRRALVHQPDSAETHFNLGHALYEQGKLEEAIASYGRALVHKPDYADAHRNLGNALKDQGKIDEAVVSHERAVIAKPDDSEAHGNLLFTLNYHAMRSPDKIHAEHLRWGARHNGAAREIHGNDRHPERRLRIGYVSPDFRAHSVASFFEPLLREHDRKVVEVFCYAEVGQPDLVTARLKALTDRWCSTVGISDSDLARKIEEDGIDILVDLAGHTANNRLPVFASKPAPLQVTWLGYPNTTGLAAMDYRLVDTVTDPEGEADGWASEVLLRLQDGFLCYGPPADVPDPAPVPGLSKGFVTFGSFNNPAKLSDPTLDVWAALLGRVPGSRLLLKGHQFFDDEAARVLFRARLVERGVAPEQVSLFGLLSDPAAHLGLYREIDIALDPFPYNGTTTTCEALWMGVPVVTLLGDRHAGRVGASVLSLLGLNALIARDARDYGEIAAGLAADSVRLCDLRADLRTRMATSPLCDGASFARKMETAYRQMWRRWCAGQPATVFDGSLGGSTSTLP